MSEWQRVKFEDLLVGKKISYGVVQPGQFQEVGGVPLIRVNNIKNAKVDVSDIVKIHEDVEAKYSKTRLCGGELLITVVGSVGECAIVTAELKGFNVARAVSVANIVDGVDKRFVAYQFRTEDLKFQMYGNTNDTVQPTLNLTELKQLTFTLPPLPEQKAIASVLSSLDDKIDLLHRQNKTLEAMAETLFRQWFIEEAKEDWEEVQLKELVFVIDNRGKTPPYLEEATDHPIIEVNALTKNGRAIDYSVIRKYVTKETFDTWFRQYLEPLDIVLSTVGSIGSFGMFFGGGGCVAQNIIGLRAQKKISNFFLYQWLVANTDEIKELDIGSVQPSIKVPHLLSLSVKIPMAEKLELFDTQVEAWVRKILANTKQIQTLENLRDTLLPKLMSGEVRVQYQTETTA
ncbi:restriction endonuclease subunit S [Acinetobacter baumannii]|uniref:restriction endonuclease subunit S n=1 Tax=Acinetobacter baumannii TaxID=470 RepID=UPI003891A6A8